MLDESPCSLQCSSSGRSSLKSSPRVSLDYSFGSHNTSFSSYTPNTKPSLVDEKRSKSLNIGPKNLMEVNLAVITNLSVPNQSIHTATKLKIISSYYSQLI